MVPASTTQWAQLGVSAEGLHRPHTAAVSSPGAKLPTATPFTTTAHPKVPSRSARLRAISFLPLWAPAGLRDSVLQKPCWRPVLMSLHQVLTASTGEMGCGPMAGGW